jgi:hypothetical protein
MTGKRQQTGLNKDRHLAYPIPCSFLQHKLLELDTKKAPLVGAGLFSMGAWQ